MLLYCLKKLKTNFSVRGIYTIYYFELSRDFLSGGEVHDFWEMIYVDKGETAVVIGDRQHILSSGQVIFIKPNEFHYVKCNSVVAPNIAIVTFDCKSVDMDFFENKIFSLKEKEREYVFEVMAEGTSAFCWKNSIEKSRLERRKQARYASEHILKNVMELLLIKLYRKEVCKTEDITILRTTKSHYTKECEAVDDYMKSNLSETLTIPLIAKNMGISASKLKKMYKNLTGHTVVEGLTNLRIEESKRLIRETAHNFTQISHLTGFQNIHYFSKMFKLKTGLTPTQYAKSIKSVSNIAIDMIEQKRNV